MFQELQFTGGKVKAIKTTVKAVLISPSKEQLNEINILMTVFSSSKRFAFKRLIEGSIQG
jgi:predicted transposase